MLKPTTPSDKAELARMGELFRNAYEGSPAETYVQSRHIGAATANAHQLGYVPEGVNGWEAHAGRLAIPYLNANKNIVWFKFRDITGNARAKYSQQAGGQQSRLFNTQALSAGGDTLLLAEGEFDVITFTALGIPCVGIPGATHWKKHWARCLDGWGRIVTAYDDDEPGRELVAVIKKELPDSTTMAVPGGYHDINEAFQAGYGPQIKALALGQEIAHEPPHPSNTGSGTRSVEEAPGPVEDPDGDPPY